METNAYDVAETVAELLAEGHVEGVVDILTLAETETHTSFVVVLESGQRLRVAIQDITLLESSDDDD